MLELGRATIEAKDLPTTNAYEEKYEIRFADQGSETSEHEALTLEGSAAEA